MRRRTALRLACGAGAGLVLATALTGGAGPVAAQDTGPGSAVTVTGKDRFANLEVTVEQTQNLVNQVVRLSFEGATPTSEGFRTGFLQIMQCWGEDPAGPTKEQCQFGGRFGTERGDPGASGRNVNIDASLVDPSEPLVSASSSGAVFVPFSSVTGKRIETGNGNEFFNASTTNEIPFARVRSDGNGEAFFEMQPSPEAPGLGCGTVTATTPKGRACWLVVVPRDDREVDGSPARGTGLTSSPLSETNWRQRLVVPLGFEPIRPPCPAGAQRSVLGQEAFVEVVSRWQPTLCDDLATSFSYTQLPDQLARTKLQSDDPGLAVTSVPLAPDLVPADRRIVYAPVALSGLTIGLLVERQPAGSATPEQLALAGSRVANIQLTPKLVAKLLTQSYRDAVPNGDPSVAANPSTVSADPEFLALNPEFEGYFYSTLSDALVPAGQSDAANLLWRYVLADAEAKAFLAGTPDASGMVVNPAYKGLDAPPSEFPKASEYCQQIDLQPELCALERRPYAQDFHDTARSSARGDNLTRAFYDAQGANPGYRQSPPPPAGQRAVLAVTDTASAARYGLATASLRNASGAFVAPTVAGLLAGQAAMKPGLVPQVLEPDLATTNAAAYPLTTLAYAATAPAKLDKASAKDYRTLLDYAVGDGQEPGVAAGTLPDGYAPLPEVLRAQTRAAAIRITADAGVVVGGTTEETVDTGDTDTGTDTGSTGGTDTGTGTDTGFDVGSGGTDLPVDPGVLDPSVPVTPVDPAAPATTPSTTDTVAAGTTTTVTSIVPTATTAAVPVGASRFVLLGAALIGLAAACFRPVLLLLSRLRRPVSTS